mmetsp:Transcript_87017/g.219037  ORF Transcript_87017/g.219037 Transcript_87017/m.219037 type:complete len:95 (-) Transcript_87017:347-631(-)|eukprot:CAMPEP_0115314218 /NCGR_PEP_ID=MMETSP0270-20121206/76915_1 /TAXON_ID=71861 /ORGANISM="Scrippsiella trochoidea, Strain CCMP3099" /LENGTH=94 /DNA_ID=CAMNT_0002733429 /DNA_START=54 /DNA_END=338 /DNA_ORIENTATION=+
MAASLRQAAAKGKDDVVRSLLENGTPDIVETRNYLGTTPLMCAAYYGHKETCRLLLGANADIHAISYDGFSAAEWADQGDNPDLADWLRRKAEG